MIGAVIALRADEIRDSAKGSTTFYVRVGSHLVLRWIVFWGACHLTQPTSAEGPGESPLSIGTAFFMGAEKA
jgi:hypothetical protein